MADDPSDPPGGDPPDPNTPRELARARNDARAHREERDRARAEVDALRKEADGLRGKLTQTQQEAERTLTEKLETLRGELGGKVTEAETKANQATDAARVRSIRADLRIAAKEAGMVDLDGLKLLDMDAVKLTDAGDVENAVALMAELKKGKPYLFGQASSSNPAAPPKPSDGKPKRATEMTDAERKAEERRLGITRN